MLFMAQADKFVHSVPTTKDYAPSYATRRTTNNWYKVWALTWRGFLIAKSYRLNFIGTYFGGALYVLFYAVLARFIGTQPASVREFGDYFTYLLIGGVFARYLSSGMKFLARELEHEMVNGTVEPLMVTPTSSALTMLGPSAWM